MTTRPALPAAAALSLLLLAACAADQPAGEPVAPAATEAAVPVPETEAADSATEPASASEPAPAATDPTAEFARFVLPGYEILGFAVGDLNRDEFPTDAVLALRKTDEADEDARPLLLLVRGPAGQLSFAGRNDNVVLCAECGGMMGDPYSGIVIKDGYFSVEHFGGSAWRWSHIVTFKHADEKLGWTLHKVGGDSFHTADPEAVETKVKTVADFGLVHFATFAGMDP